MTRTRVTVTGAHGQFGWHLCCRLFGAKDIDVTSVGRAEFADPDALAEACAGADMVVHLAGVNRGTDEEIAQANPALASALVRALEKSGGKPHLIYSSSIHALGDSNYGRAKRRTGEVLARWAEATGSPYTEFVFPHLFGEHARPFYNSVVSTICHQFAKGETPEINPAGQVELLHFGDAAEMIIAAFREAATGQQRPQGIRMSVPELAARVEAMADSYRQRMVIPDLRDPLQLRLFNTYRSYLYPDIFPVGLTKHTDDRGALVELVKADNGGQAFISTTKPGITRGQHFHYGKVERFLVVEGKARISIRRMLTSERQDFDVEGGAPRFVDMPTLHTHNITNTGDDMLVTMFWTHEIFNPEHPDTVFEPV